MTVPGGVPNLPAAALTIENLATRLQDQTVGAMRDLASQRVPAIFDGSTGGTLLSDLSPFGIITHLWAGFVSVVGNADPADIDGPEDLPGLLYQFIESLPFAGELLGLLEAILGTYDGTDPVLLAVQEIFFPIRKLLQLISGQDVGFPTVEEITAGWEDLGPAIVENATHLAQFLAATGQATFTAAGAQLVALLNLIQQTIDNLAHPFGLPLTGNLPADLQTAFTTVAGQIGNLDPTGIYDAAVGFGNQATSLLKYLTPTGGNIGQFDASQLQGSLNDAVQIGSTAVSSIFNGTGQFIGVLNSSATGALNSAITYSGTALSTVLTNITASTGALNAAGLSGALNNAVTIGGQAFSTIFNGSGQFTGVLNSSATGALNGAITLGGTALTALSTNWNAAVTDINSLITGVGGTIIDDVNAYLQNVPNTAVQGLDGFASNLGASVQAGFDGVWQGLRAFLGVPSGIGPPQVASAGQQVRVDLNNATDIATLARTIQAAAAITKQSFLAIDPSADPVFPLSNISGASPTTVPVVQTKSVMGCVLLPDVSKKKSVTWLGGPLTNITGVYVNLYKVNKTTGEFTRFHASSNIVGSLSNPVSGTAWNFYNLPMANYFDVTVDGTGGTTTPTLAIGDYVVVEIVTVGSGTYNVVGFTNGIPTHTTIFPKGLGASRVTPATLARVVAAGVPASTTKNPTWSHAYVSGDSIVVDVNGYSSTSAITAIAATFGGVSMTLLKLTTDYAPGGDFAYVASFGLLASSLTGLSTGSQTVAITTTGGGTSGTQCAVGGTSSSYSNVTAFGTPQSTSGTGGSTQTVTGLTMSNTTIIHQVFAALGSGGNYLSGNQNVLAKLANNSFVNAQMISDQIALATSLTFTGTTTSGTTTGFAGVAIPITVSASPLVPVSIASPTYDTATPWIALAGAAGRSQHAAETVEFETSGSGQTYTVPAWVEDGDYIDIVPIGAGAGGSHAGTRTTTLNTAYKGGGAGDWEPTRLQYGDDYDIPTGTTTFTVNVGAGGAGAGNPGLNQAPVHGSDGGDTTVVITGVPTITADGGVKDGTTQTATYLGVFYKGDTPGNVVHEGVTYFGGAFATLNGVGNSPGGGGGAGVGDPVAGSNPGAAGAPGAVYITAVQN